MNLTLGGRIRRRAGTCSGGPQELTSQRGFLKSALRDLLPTLLSLLSE